MRPAVSRPDPCGQAAESIETPFGTFRLDRAAMVEFPSGLPGFEQCGRFVLLASEELRPFSCLHAVDGAPASFLVIDPRDVVPDYQVALGQTDLLRLGCHPGEPLILLSLVGFDEGGAPYANLRAPIAINPARMRGCQLLPHQSPHPLRCPLSTVPR
jgi:flagellar assembly factor FliW